MNPNNPIKAEESLPMPADWTNPNPAYGVSITGHRLLGRVVYAQNVNHLIAGIEKTAEIVAEQTGCDIRRPASDPKWRGIPKQYHDKGQLEAVKSVGVIAPIKDDDAVKQMQDALPSMMKDMRQREFIYQTNAGNMSLSRLFAGRPDFMRRSKSLPQQKPIVGIGVNVSANADINANIVALRGIVATIAAEILELRGYPVEVFAVELGSGAYYQTRTLQGHEIPRNNATIVKIKGAGEVFNEGKMQNALSAWFFRTGLFHAIRMGDPEQVTGGLGSAMYGNDDIETAIAKCIGVDEFTMARYKPSSNTKPAELEKAIKAFVGDILDRYPI